MLLILLTFLCSFVGVLSGETGHGRHHCGSDLSQEDRSLCVEPLSLTPAGFSLQRTVSNGESDTCWTS